MNKIALTITVCAFVALTGCATKRYGRMMNVVPAEARELNCDQIGIELAKVDGFEQQVNAGAKIDWKSVMGFLGDYGIGNAMEKNEAIKSAENRKAELRQLQANKGCRVT